MKRSVITALTFALSFPIAGTVMAAEGDLVGQRFKHADIDSDGRIDRQQAIEHMPRVGKNFDRIDTDKDGYITLKDIRDVMSERGG